MLEAAVLVSVNIDNLNELSKLKKSISKILLKINKLKKNNINIKTFFAPNHTYDETTFTALKQSGINEVIDGYGLLPYTYKQIRFIPQLFYKTVMLPIGIQSTQLHINYWDEKDFKKFEKFIVNNHKKIYSYNEVIKFVNDNYVFKIINITIEKILKLKRIFT